MVDTVINYLDKFGPELLVIQFGLLIILLTLFMWLWFANRRKYHNLKHAIPASVVKSYLDSIIQNSTALKSQLFRGGGLDMSAVPSVMPLQNLIGGEGVAVSGAPSTALLEEINQKKALIASLESQLSSQQNSGREVEKKLSNSQENLSSAERKIKELEALLSKKPAGAVSSGGNDAALQAELSEVTRERDDLRDRLREFEIIADDLANLKRLQQENEQLKKSLSAQGGSLPASSSAPAPARPAVQEPAKAIDPNNILSQADVSDLLQDLGQSSDSKTSEDEKQLDEFLSASSSDAETEEASPESVNESVEAASEEEQGKAKGDKTPEDLLSEFEKMLG